MFSCSEFPWQLYVGKDFSVSNSIKTDLEAAFAKRFDFIRVPLVHPRYSKHPSVRRLQPLTRSDSCLASQQWNNCVQGKCTEDIDPDHDSMEVRKKWEEIMVNELRWGVHLGVNAIVLTCPGKNCSFSGCILREIKETVSRKFCVHAVRIQFLTE